MENESGQSVPERDAKVQEVAAMTVEEAHRGRLRGLPHVFFEAPSMIKSVYPARCWTPSCGR